MNFKEELFIENQRVDLYNGGKILRTLTLNSLGNITEKQSSYSNTIKLPKTANNILIFEGLGIEGNTSTSPYRRLKCDYYYNKLPVFNFGYAIVNSNSSDSFNITIYNGLVEVSEVLKGKTLDDLNLSGLTHNLNYSNVINDDELPFTYSVLINSLNEEENTFGVNNEFNLSNTFPLIKHSFIFKEIFNQAGFEVEGDLFEDENFLKESSLITEGFDVPTPTIIEDSSITGLTLNTLNIDNTYSETGTAIERSFQIEGLPIDDTNSEIRLYTSGFEAKIDSIGTIDITPTFDLSFGEDCRIFLRINNGTSFDDLLLIDFGDSDTDSGITKSVNFPLVDGYTYQLLIRVSRQDVGGGDSKIQFDLDIDIDFLFNSVVPTSIDGNLLKLGTTKQIDFIKDVAIRYGLVLKKSSFDNKVFLKNINSLLNSTSEAIDFSSKLITIKDEVFTNNYSQENYLKYKYTKRTDDLTTDGFFDDYFNLDNKLANLSSTFYSSIFEIFNEFPTEKEYLNGDYSSNIDSFIPLVDKLVEEVSGTTETTLTYTSNNIKLISFEKSSSTSTYFLKYNDLPKSVITDYYIKPKLPVKPSTTIDTYYSDFIRVLENYKTINVKLNLDFKDIYDFDFFKLIFFKQTGKYYYCNKLKYNVASTIVDAEMVEIPFNNG